MSAGRSGRRSRRASVKPKAEINLTNLLDIVFTLLIAFIIATPALTHSLEVQLPGAQPPADAPTPEPEEAKVVTIAWGGTPEGPHSISVDGAEMVDFEELEAEARTWNAEQTVSIAVDRRVPSEWLLRAAVALQRGGVAGYHFVYKDEAAKSRR